MKKQIRKYFFIFNGLSGVGKSYLSKILSNKLKIPLISVDNIIKERIFDSKLYICKSNTPKDSLEKCSISKFKCISKFII